MRPFRRPDDELAEAFVAEAERWLGHRCRLGAPNEFGRRAGYDGLDHPWDGAFLDCVAFDAGLAGLPALTGTVAGMGELLKTGRAVQVPRRGDVVFFAFPVTGHFTGPHVGLVVDGSRFSKSGEVDVLEAQVGSPQPRGPKDADGIYVRRRSVHDVIMFARPALRRRPGQGEKTLTGPLVSVAQLRAQRPNESVGLVQSALLKVFPHAGLGKVFRADGHAGLSTTKRWDGPTRAAFARYQRSIGYVGPDATGSPDDVRALRRLGDDSGLFSVED